MTPRTRNLVLLVALLLVLAYCRGPGAETVVARAIEAAEAHDVEEFDRWTDTDALERSLARQILARYPSEDPPDEELFARALRGRVHAWVEADGPPLDRGALSRLFPEAALRSPVRETRDRVELPVVPASGSPLVLLLDVERPHPFTRRRVTGVTVRRDGWSVQPFADTVDEMIAETGRRMADFERFLR